MVEVSGVNCRYIDDERFEKLSKYLDNLCIKDSCYKTKN